jgi:hypothetical protein
MQELLCKAAFLASTIKHDSIGKIAEGIVEDVREQEKESNDVDSMMCLQNEEDNSHGTGLNDEPCLEHRHAIYGADVRTITCGVHTDISEEGNTLPQEKAFSIVQLSHDLESIEQTCIPTNSQIETNMIDKVSITEDSESSFLHPQQDDNAICCGRVENDNQQQDNRETCESESCLAQNSVVGSEESTDHNESNDEQEIPTRNDHSVENEDYHESAYGLDQKDERPTFSDDVVAGSGQDETKIENSEQQKVTRAVNSIENVETTVFATLKHENLPDDRDAACYERHALAAGDKAGTGDEAMDVSVDIVAPVGDHSEGAEQYKSRTSAENESFRDDEKTYDDNFHRKNCYCGNENVKQIYKDSSDVSKNENENGNVQVELKSSGSDKCRHVQIDECVKVEDTFLKVDQQIRDAGGIDGSEGVTIQNQKNNSEISENIENEFICESNSSCRLNHDKSGEEYSESPSTSFYSCRGELSEQDSCGNKSSIASFHTAIRVGAELSEKDASSERTGLDFLTCRNCDDTSSHPFDLSSRMDDRSANDLSDSMCTYYTCRKFNEQGLLSILKGGNKTSNMEIEFEVPLDVVTRGGTQSVSIERKTKPALQTRQKLLLSFFVTGIVLLIVLSTTAGILLKTRQMDHKVNVNAQLLNGTVSTIVPIGISTEQPSESPMTLTIGNFSELSPYPTAAPLIQSSAPYDENIFSLRRPPKKKKPKQISKGGDTVKS